MQSLKLQASPARKKCVLGKVNVDKIGMNANPFVPTSTLTFMLHVLQMWACI